MFSFPCGNLILNFEDATHGAQKTLGDQIRKNPDRILNNIEKVNVRLITERYAFANVSFHYLQF
jgi:hypothetical protein